MTKKKESKTKAEVHKDLEGFDIKIDPFGKMRSNFPIEKLNKFLDDQVDDKKIILREEEYEEE